MEHDEEPIRIEEVSMTVVCSGVNCYVNLRRSEDGEAIRARLCPGMSISMWKGIIGSVVTKLEELRVEVVAGDEVGGA